jgi:hypothetical protein
MTFNSSSIVWRLRQWHTNNYWYCEIQDGMAFDNYPIDTLIPADMLNLIKTDDNTFLVICNIFEAFHSIVEPLYKNLVFQNIIPPEKIIILSESADLHKAVSKFAIDNNVKPFNVEWIMLFNSIIQQDKIELLKTKNNCNTLELKSYKKRFLNFNRRWRMHRPTLVALLIAKGLIDTGYVSLGSSDDDGNWESVFWWIEDSLKSDTEFSELLTKHKHTIMNYPPLYVDTTDLKTNHIPLEADTNYFYENSLVSIITETNFYTTSNFEQGRFLSEKTIKPLAQRHPFIIVSVPGTLELLRSIGYKTFHPFINESYDTELDDIKRMKLIVNEIERIANMTDSEVTEFILAVKPLVDYNFELFIKNRVYRYKTL